MQIAQNTATDRMLAVLFDTTEDCKINMGVPDGEEGGGQGAGPFFLNIRVRSPPVKVKKHMPFWLVPIPKLIKFSHAYAQT